MIKNLHISTEYRRGVLFIRLTGRNDDVNVLVYVSNIVEKFGIKYVVININNLNNISLDSIKYIIEYNKKILKNNQCLIICDSTRRMNRLFGKLIPKINNELDVFSLI